MLHDTSGESSVGELAAPFDVSPPAISRHLRVLESAGLISRRKEGRVHRCRLEPEPMRLAADWIGRYRAFWETQFDALRARILELAQARARQRSRSVPSSVVSAATARSPAPNP